MALSQALRCSVLRSAIPLACSPVCSRVSASAAPHYTAQSRCLRTSAFVPSLSAFRPKAQRAQQSASFATQAVKKGDKLPTDVEVQTLAEDGNKVRVTLGEITKGKKVVLVGVPGAYTPVCSSSHIPGFVEKVKEFSDKGVDYVGVIANNDIFVMREWGKTMGCEGANIKMISDGNTELSKALGVTVDMTSRTMGVRTRRFAMYVDDGEVKAMSVEEDENGGADSDEKTNANWILQNI
ncbi:hypothetical protein WJX82_010227 [Trebouxia sp. C0006]